jgi:hypothetical protein
MTTYLLGGAPCFLLTIYEYPRHISDFFDAQIPIYNNGTPGNLENLNIWTAFVIILLQ